MNHRERIENAIGLKETDRLPFGFWRHFPYEDRDPQRFAEVEVGLQEKLDLDFVKYMPFAHFSVVDWGVKTKSFPNKLDPPITIEYPIKKSDDWENLKKIRGREGEYGVVLHSQRIAVKALKGRVPLVQTVFSPLTTCLKLAGLDQLLDHLRNFPDKVHAGLEIITETARQFALEALKEGADGIFLGSQMSNADRLDKNMYREFVKEYDLAILEDIKKLSWFNILHLHGQNVLLAEVLDYPVQVLNWHDRDSGPSLSEARRMTNKCFLGGIGHGSVLLNGTPEQVAAHVDEAVEQTAGIGIILGPGCSASTRTPEQNILQLRKSVGATRKKMIS